MRLIGLAVVLAVSLLLAPLAGEAQPPGKVYRIGFLWDGPAVLPDAIAAFRRGLRDLGWVEGQNIALEYRWSKGAVDRFLLAEELVRLKVDIIVAPNSIYTEAAKRATSTIPIVFALHADPILSGHVASLARPGANITGISLNMTETNAKGLELLREAVPGLSRVAVLWHRPTPSHRPGLDAVEVRARALGVRVQAVGVQNVAELEGAFSAMIRERAGGVLVLSTTPFIDEARQLAELAVKHRLPTMFGPRVQVERGGLMSFGPDRPELFRRAATHVDKILKGAKPGDLPVEQPTKFEFVINLKTAKTLGLTIPPSVLGRADHVIE